jgi:hypothetical protein
MYKFFILFFILAFGCVNGQKQTIVPSEVQDSFIIDKNNYECNSLSCRPKNDKVQSNKRYYHGTGWALLLPYKWRKYNSNKAEEEFLAYYYNDEIYVNSSIKVMNHKDPCPWRFVKKMSNKISKTLGVSVNESSVLEIGGAKTVVLFFINTDNIVGVHILTAFKDHGYIVTCSGKSTTYENTRTILGYCSDFANSLNFN